MSRLCTLLMVLLLLTACAGVAPSRRSQAAVDEQTSRPPRLLTTDAIGTYAVLEHRVRLTDTRLRVTRADGGMWHVMQRVPSGGWRNVTCEGACQLKSSSQADVRRFVGISAGTTACVHNIAFAFCANEMESDPLSKYVMVALTRGAPVAIGLVRLPD
jgi:hypothetical protein